jgi:hypothetical protein
MGKGWREREREREGQFLEQKDAKGAKGAKKRREESGADLSAS